MATVRHPVVDRPTLAWEKVGSVYTAYTEVTAKYRRGNPYKVRESFALLRPAYNSLGLFTHDGTGWVVTRNDFDEIREFSEFSTARLYIESLFALEHGG